MTRFEPRRALLGTLALALVAAPAARAVEAPPTEAPVLVAVVEAEANVLAPEKIRPVVAEPCRFRDPVDGACYVSADAADRAWLSGKAPAVTVEARTQAHDSFTSVSSTSVGELVVDDPDDPEEDEAEDGGRLAPVDQHVTAPAPESPAKLSFWKNLARTVKGLVVRKSDSQPASLPEEELAALFQADFPLPLGDFNRAKMHDSFNQPRGKHRRHHAIDLPAPRGTPVVAVVDGVVERMGRDRKGGKVVYLKDAAGRYTFYYAHLAKHEEGLRPGMRVKKGQRLGEVGSTGHVIGGPHLHFAIFRPQQSESPWKGLVVNPYLVFVSTVRGGS